MNAPNTSVGRTPSLLSRQLAELLAFLEQSQPYWIDSQLTELSDVPRELENHIQKISYTLTELRKKLRSAGWSNLQRWEETTGMDKPANGANNRLGELAQQVRRLSRIQNLLAQNLLWYMRGVAMLNQNRRDAVYCRQNRNNKNLGYLRYRG